MKEINMQSSIEELKAAAYDTLSEIERLNKQLQVLNGMINQKMNTPVIPESEEIKKPKEDKK